MAAKIPDGVITDRAKNFRWDTEGFEENVRANPNCFAALETLKDEIIVFSSSDKAKDLSHLDLLHNTFSQTYHLIVESIPFLKPFYNQQPLRDAICEAGLFTTLCTFLHSSKRIKGTPLKEFVRKHHPLDFDNIESPYGRIELLNDESNRLRQFRHRLFSKRKVYVKDSQWAAMPKDSEYEWLFFYTLEQEGKDESLPEAVRDTFKRIKNLHTDIYKASRTAKDDGYAERLKNAYKKYISKLSKIKYENYLELQKAFLSHICENEEYYGLNIYRLEKEMSPYITTHEIKRLSMCQSDDEKAYILMQYALLNDICFPKVYELISQRTLYDVMMYAMSFSKLFQDINVSACLILDELVEKGNFGNDWENFIRISINRMTESVFYKPCELKFTVTTESQKNFIDLLSAPTNYFINQEIARISGKENDQY